MNDSAAGGGNPIADLSLKDVKHLLREQKKMLQELLPFAPNDEERNKMKKRMEASALKLVRTYLVSTAREDLMNNLCEGNKLQEDIVSNDSDEEAMHDISEIKTKYEEAEAEFIESQTDKKVKKHEIFAKHLEELNDIFDGFVDDSGDTTMIHDDPSQNVTIGNETEYIPTLDPVTKRLLIDPVKNKICGHIYGKTSILQLIANDRARCPYSGCSSKTFIQQKHLVTSAELSRKIAEKIADSQKRTDSNNPSRQQGQRNPVHLDETL